MAEQHQTVAGDHNVTVQNMGDRNSFTITVGAETRLVVTRKHRLGAAITTPLHLLLPENAVAPLVGRDAVKRGLDTSLDRAELIAARSLKARAFTGATVRHALDEDHVGLITEAGADQTHLTMQEAGRSLAAHAIEATAPPGAAGAAAPSTPSPSGGCGATRYPTEAESEDRVAEPHPTGG